MRKFICILSAVLCLACAGPAAASSGETSGEREETLQIQAGRKPDQTEQGTEYPSGGGNSPDSGKDQAGVPTGQGDSGTDRQSGHEKDPEKDPAKESEKSPEKDPAKESEEKQEKDPAKGSEEGPEKDPAKGSEEGPEKDPAKESEEEPETGETEAVWKLVVGDIHVILPEGGRVYDGTDAAEVGFSYQLLPDNEKAEEDGQTPPADVQVVSQARLESPDAGEQNVLYSFSMVNGDPDKVHFAEDMQLPALTVAVQKRVLSVTIPDGRKVYAEKADADHIWPEDASSEEMNRTVGQRQDGVVPAEKALQVQVSGFLTDSQGTVLIPEGFEAPEIMVDSEVLADDSPMFKDGKEAVYRKALVMKRKEDGSLTGNPTPNYVFCENPDDPACRCGDVRITARKAREGKDYKIGGNESIRSQGQVIVGRGGSFEVDVRPNSPFNSGETVRNIVSGGEVAFKVRRYDSGGQLLAESLPEKVQVTVDSQVPAPKLQIPDLPQKGDLSFSASAVSVSLTPQADGQSGLDFVAYRLLGTDARSYRQGKGLTEKKGWTEAAADGTSAIHLKNEGVWQIEARSMDRAGNAAVSRSGIIVIDRTKPQLSIRGVTDGTAYSGDVRLSFSCSDPWYLEGSSRIDIRPALGGKVPAEASRQETDTGVRVDMADFDHVREADAYYTATFSAKDLCGNETAAQVTFSVNRFGSTYGIGSGTRQALRSYYHTKPFDVRFLETNLSEIRSAKILVMKDGKRMKDVQIVREEVPSAEGEGGMKHVRYTVGRDNFRKDGSYEVILMTSDLAGNSSDSQKQRIPVRFAIDSQKPECLISGVKSGQAYRAESLTAAFEVRDNLAVNKADAYLNSRLIKSWSGEEISRQKGVLKVTVPGKESWQTMQIHVEDAAGNDSWTGELPFYVSLKEPREEYRQDKKSAEELLKEESEGLSESESDETEPETENAAETGNAAEAENAAEADQADLADSDRDMYKENRKDEHMESGKGSKAALLPVLAAALTGGLFMFFHVRQKKGENKGE